MKNIIKNKKILFGMILGIIFIISTSVTYAWFSLQVSGNEEARNIVVETGSLELTYFSSKSIRNSL